MQQDLSCSLTTASLASEPKRRHFISRYHAMLEKIDVPSFAKSLQQDLRQRRVLYGERLTCPFLRPSFVTEEQYRLICRAVSDLTNAMQALMPLILESAEVQKFLGITEEEQKLFAVDPGYHGLSITSRLDGFLNGGACSFVEYNAESPAGIGYTDRMTEAFMARPEFKSFAEANGLRSFFCSQPLLGALLRCYNEWGGHDKPVIAIVDFDNLPTSHEFHILAEYFISKGYQTIIADPRSLEYRNGKLWAGDQSIDLIYRRVLTSEYLQHFKEELPLFEAYRNHDVCLVNSFRSKILHKKTIFAMLTDEKYHGPLSSQQIATIKAHLPWTRRLSPGKTTNPEGQECDLLEYVTRYRQNLVLKPNDSYGGRGITFGWEANKSQWQAAVDKALAGDYLVQKRVATERELFPTWENEALNWGEYIVDFDPYVFDFALAGITARLSASSLCNVTSGGGSIPCFIIP